MYRVNNHTEATSTLDKLRHAKALDTFDFSTLYNIPNGQIRTRMEELIIRNAYSTRVASLIASGKDYDYWTSGAVANTHSLTVNQLAR